MAPTFQGGKVFPATGETSPEFCPVLIEIRPVPMVFFGGQEPDQRDTNLEPD